ncbi:MAG: NADH-quinone oxidoreductase subunit J [Propionibacterium sp.]|nr:NADH-quinone oxidoreductase subunit J [Propionibacterium sp.]
MNISAAWPAMGSTGEAILFWCVATVMVVCALGVLFFRKAAYSAISMVGVMLGLAILYVAQGAPFLGSVQVVVYTGAIMMLFLFVIMMIGIGATDDYRRQRRGNIVAASLGGVGLAVVLVGILGHTQMPEAKGLGGADPYSNEPVTALATTLFRDHWFSMELSGVLLITAAIGAMLLTHTDRLGPAVNQHSTARAKMRAFKESGRRIGQLPAPGVYATSNAVDVPAIAGDTLGPVEESVPRVLRVRGLDRSISQVEPDVAEALQLMRSGDHADSPFGAASSGAVPRSGSWGMPGPAAPQGLDQPAAAEDEGQVPRAVDVHEGATPAPGDVSQQGESSQEGDAAGASAATTAQEAPDAGRPGTDHVSGPGEHAAHTHVEGEEKE